MEIGICSATLNFKDDAVGFSKIFKELHLDTGEFTKRYCVSHDDLRIKKMEIKSSDEAKA